MAPLFRIGPVHPVLATLLLAFASGCSPETSATDLGGAVLPEPWPPRVDERYPDLELLDVEGRPVRLSSYEGRTILLEPIGMNCPAYDASGHQPRHDLWRELLPALPAILDGG